MKGLRKREYEQIRDELDNCKNPLYFFHDDPDGVCSFLQFYRYKGEGVGVIVKSTPRIDHRFLKKVREVEPDKIFVLDIADITQEFIDKTNVPIIWFDHHGPYDRKKVKYFNPRVIDGSNPPVSFMSYFVFRRWEWISLIGTVSDWYLPEEKSREILTKDHKDLLPDDISRPEDALFDTKAGLLSKIISFALKGTHSDAMKYVRVLTRIKSPYEILNQETAQGRYIYKKYEKINGMYDSLLKEALRMVDDSGFLIFTYSEDNMSFTGDLANELLYRYPEKMIVIAREKSGEMKCSLRSSAYVLPHMIDKAIAGFKGHGGGHEHAAGAVVKKEDFDEFINRLRAQVP